MGTEVERKFLVRSDEWRVGAKGRVYRQGYLSTDPDRTVRIRVIDRGYVTIKGRARGLVRAEYEYPLPASDANEMLDRLCLRPLIEKSRYRVPHAGHVWEVDEFFGENRGLLLAEVELADPGEPFEMPDWVGQEVSGDPRYQNANLVKRPFSRW
jgi:adenylate cyclase